MNYFKLGCHWGAGNPDFYNLLKKHSFVICSECNMQEGDIVAIANGYNVVALAKILENKYTCTSKPELEKEFNNYKIDYEEWNCIAKAKIWELDEQDRFEYRLQQGICQINKQETINTIMSLINTIESKKIIEDCKKILINNHNLILTGAPGTGKTYLAKEIANSLDAKGDQLGFVQFHPSLDYTDFVEGMRPVKDINTNTISFERKDGIFMAFCRKALLSYQAKEKDDAPKYVFIIDEINRGELSKIFGELFFSIDPGYRGPSGSVSTQYSNMWSETDLFDITLTRDEQRKFYIPKNVYIIATMNDIDRSVESMDFAIRRRFAFKDIKAETRIEMIKENKLLQPYFENIIEHMKNLNLCILTMEGFNTAYQIGASYYLKLENYLIENNIENSTWQELWDNHLYGLLFEYFRGNPKGEEALIKLKRAFDLVDRYEIKDNKVVKINLENNE